MLVEQCEILEIVSLGDSLRKFRKGENGISGMVKLPSGREVNFWFDDKNGENFVFALCRDNEPQEIAMTETGTTFGMKSYFVCECGYRASKLYLPPLGKRELKFKCRKCHNLRYELEMINRNSMQGRFLYKTNRMIKAINMRESLGNRIFYGGRYSKRFENFLALCDRAGLKENAEDARTMMSEMQAQRI